MTIIQERYICRAGELQNGTGIRFRVRRAGAEQPAFAIRYDGRPYAYLNRCAHMELELDLIPGRFFDNEQRFLVCATHGAIYEPHTGKCVLGPCRGGRLEAVKVGELASQLVLTDNDYQLASPSTEVTR